MSLLKHAGHYTQDFDFSAGDVIKANNLPQVSVGMSYITNSGKGYGNYNDLLNAYFDPDFEGDGRLYDSECRDGSGKICRMFFNVHTYRVGTVIYDERTLFSYGSHYAMCTLVFARQNSRLLDTVWFAHTERRWSNTTTNQLHSRVLPARFAASLDWRDKFGVVHTPNVTVPTEDDVLDLALTPVTSWAAVLSVFDKYQDNPHRKLKPSEATDTSLAQGSLERCDVDDQPVAAPVTCTHCGDTSDTEGLTFHEIDDMDVCHDCAMEMIGEDS